MAPCDPLKKSWVFTWQKEGDAYVFAFQIFRRVNLPDFYPLPR